MKLTPEQLSKRARQGIHLLDESLISMMTVPSRISWRGVVAGLKSVGGSSGGSDPGSTEVPMVAHEIAGVSSSWSSLPRCRVE